MSLIAITINLVILILYMFYLELSYRNNDWVI